MKAMEPVPKDIAVSAMQAAGELPMPAEDRNTAGFQIAVSDDLMSAYLTVNSCQRGEPPQFASVLVELQRKGIVFGILTADIEAALSNGECEHLLIANGVAPKEGTPGRFENLLPKEEQHLAEIDENAVVQYADLTQLVLVEQGDPLLRRIPSIPGEDGVNLLGQAIAAPEVPEIEFAEKDGSVELDPQDPNVLLAACSGQPVVTAAGASVNPVLEVEDVGFKTGNIAFEGTIVVKGDVQAGMRVKVSGDVIVHGMIETAEIVAGGNVAVVGGIIGRANPKPGVHALPPDTARIECAGTLQARFIENVKMKCEMIVIEAHSRNCELLARDQIIVGKPGAKNSHLAGGTAQATQLIRVLNLGAVNAMKTQIQVGSDPELAQEIAANAAHLAKKMEEFEQTQKMLAVLAKNPQKNVGGVSEKFEALRKQLSDNVFALIKEKDALLAKFKLTLQARVEVTDSLHEGVEIRIGNQISQVRDQRRASSIRLAEERIVFEPI
ncbi:FapA family protein [soil metagenome]